MLRGSCQYYKNGPRINLDERCIVDALYLKRRDNNTWHCILRFRALHQNCICLKKRELRGRGSGTAGITKSVSSRLESLHTGIIVVSRSVQIRFFLFSLISSGHSSRLIFSDVKPRLSQCIRIHRPPEHPRKVSSNALDHQALHLVLEGADLVVEVGGFVGGDARQKLLITISRPGLMGGLLGLTCRQ